jgi:hypothetical protein
LVLIQIQRNAVHIFHKTCFEGYFNITLPLKAMTSTKSLLYRSAFKNLKYIWNPQYKIKQKIVKCNIRISFLWQKMA